MPNEMIERVAKALHKFELEHGFITREWQGINSEISYGVMARAAIEAMRDLTDKMLFDGRIDLGAGGELDDENLKEVFGLMIDAALKD